MKTLREWRLDRLLSILRLEQASGVTKKTIIDIEHGRQLPRLRTIRRLSEALDVPPREVTEFNQALDELGKGEPLNAPGARNPVAGATATGRSKVYPGDVGM